MQHVRIWVMTVGLSAALLGCGAGDNSGSNGTGGGGGNQFLGTGSSGNGASGAGGGNNSGETCNGVLTGRIRDFHYTYPDMEPGTNNTGKSNNSDDRGITTDTIGSDFKPVYAGGPDGTITTTGPDNFNRWYRDTDGVNDPMNLDLKFADPDGDGVATYDDQTFFPIDGQLFGNEPPDPDHNFHFTFELHTKFTYNGGEVFTFIGDDDVWAYINDKRVVNLGGIHGAETGDVSLDSLGLTRGTQYQLDFFFAERHVTESHFRIDTSLKFIDCGSIILK